MGRCAHILSTSLISSFRQIEPSALRFKDTRSGAGTRQRALLSELVEYGDFECPFCGQAEPVLRELLRDFTDVRYVWRHLPLTDVHVHAQLAAEAAEAAAEQDAFWEMHDLLLDHQDALNADDLIRYATQLGLDFERFANDLRKGVGAARVADDVDGADLSGVNGTPTFFINGRRHYGAYDIGTLSAAVRAAGARAMLAQT
jgi:protein-disulfide isomerase